ncbi:hypothetical protein DQ04_02861000 [Trypanosoma grayi]|uniref:hypothetical protein n=1 Tax=Trypanosoma grayi TaxID=71804 RepID=UPI0004F487F5|nr:hypothetical protein DQ04_02861000 [Trypanosoma grayi]KEG11200.1 hypothetical protein DQ04_02861000 [Trypanosoma grayi]
MIQGFCFQDMCDPISHPYGGDVTSVLANNSPFADATATPADKQHDVWGSSVFYLPELGADLQNEPHHDSAEKGNSNGNSQVVPSHTCVPAQVTISDERTTSLVIESKATIAPTPSAQCLSFGSTGAQSTVPSAKNGGMNPPIARSVVYPPNTNQLSFSSLMCVGTTTMSPNSNNNNNGMTYQQASPVTTAIPGNLPAFFTTAQGGNNVVMRTHTPSPQTLYISPGAPTMIPYYVLTSPQPGLEVNGAMAYSSMPAAPQPMGTVMYGQWHPTAGAALGSASVAAPTPAGVPVASLGMPPAFTTRVVTSAPQPVANFASAEANPNSGSEPSPINPCGDNSAAHKAAPKGSPPSYDSLRLQLTKRRQPPGRQRSGTNVHGSLQGICAYYSYNLSAALKQYEQPDAHPTKPGEQVLPVFIQMFPCELRDRTIIVLNRVVEATCGPDVATVVGIEPRSETSFITLVRTNEVWLLIHKLRCRVLMDRHGFWYAENMEQYLRLKEYCEGVRRLPQQMRHFQTDGLPCMPLVVELSRSVNAAAVTSPPAPPSFDEVAPIATVERHARTATATGSNDDGDSSPRCESGVDKGGVSCGAPQQQQ